MVTDWSKFETFEESTGHSIPPIEKPKQQETNSAPTDWSQFEEAPPEESAGMASLRSAYQPFAGYAQKFTWPADIVAAGAEGMALGTQLEQNDNLAWASQFRPKEVQEKIAAMHKPTYDEMRQQAAETYPSYLTQSGLEKKIEELTGLPLTPRTTIDQVLRLGGNAAGFRGGSYFNGTKLAPGAMARTIEKGVAGVTAPLVSEGLQKMGVPEPIAENIGLLGAQFTPVPRSIPTGTTPIMKKSGMPQRNFESITKPTKISESYHGTITQNIETDMRQATDKLFSEASPTYVEMKTNPGFRDERIAGMENVQNLASGLSRKINTNDVRKEFISAVNKRIKESGGIAHSEFDRELLKEANILLRGTKINRAASASDLLRQYRKANSDKGKLFELGSSTSRNEAKQEALRLHNNAVSNIIETKYPQTDFAKEFLKENKAWAAMEDADKAKNIVDSLFTPEGIKFKDAQKLLKDNSTTRGLRRMLGKEKFGNLQEIARDFVSQGNKYKLLKPVEGPGVGSMVKDALLFPTHPLIAGTSLAKTGYQHFKGRGLKNVSSNVKWSQVPQNEKTGLQKFTKDVYQDFKKPTP